MPNGPECKAAPDPGDVAASMRVFPRSGAVEESRLPVVLFFEKAPGWLTLGRDEARCEAKCLQPVFYQCSGMGTAIPAWGRIRHISQP
jgi:hypothetical protein